MADKPLIAITVGDPGGIGPEITAKALALPEIYEICRPVVISDIRLFQAAVEIARGNLKTELNTTIADTLFLPGHAAVLDMDNVDLSRLCYGQVTAAGGKASYEYVAKAIKLAMNNQVDAIVTGPIHKKALNLAGYPYAGHTEILAALTATREYCMMLVDGSFRVSHITTHIPLKDVAVMIKRQRVLTVLKLTHEALKKICGKNPRLAVAGLNPHSGDGGLFGREEITEIAPAIEEARKLNINVEGPLSADTVFVKMRGGQYDGVVAMYHDQGHIPMKLIGFRFDSKRGQWGAVSGVNITLGLPIIRTSVDHGVAFGKAGRGTANADSMVEAIRIAAQLAGIRETAGN